jgi:hypothetical protein
MDCKTLKSLKPAMSSKAGAVKGRMVCQVGTDEIEQPTYYLTPYGRRRKVHGQVGSEFGNRLYKRSPPSQIAP